MSVTTTELESLLASLRPPDVPIDELMRDLFYEYNLKGKDAYAKQSRSRWEKHIRPFFGGLSASEVGTQKQQEYRTKRREAGASPATINKEMMVMCRAFKIGYQHEPPKLAR